MYIILGDDNFIKAASWGGKLLSAIEIEDFEFVEDINAYKYIDEKIVLDKERLQQLQHEQMEQKELQELQEVLSETDALALQWWEESQLGMEHEIPVQEFQQIMKKRQETRVKIKKLLHNSSTYRSEY